MVTRKNALQRLWNDSLTVVAYIEKTNANGSTGFEEAAVIKDVPCKLSFSTLQAVDQSDAGAAVVQAVKIFCASDVAIDAGSKLIVRHGGRVHEFSQSGEPGVFTDHQEIVLVPFRGWA